MTGPQTLVIKKTMLVITNIFIKILLLHIETLDWDSTGILFTKRNLIRFLKSVLNTFLNQVSKSSDPPIWWWQICRCNRWSGLHEYWKTSQYVLTIYHYHLTLCLILFVTDIEYASFVNMTSQGEVTEVTGVVKPDSSLYFLFPIL